MTIPIKYSKGNLPKGWRWAKLGDICEVQLGKMLSPASRVGLRAVPYLRNANVQWNRFDLTDIAEMDFSEEQEAMLSLRSDDLLVCEGGEPGRAAVWQGQISRCCYQKALHRLRPIATGVDPYFVMYRLWKGAFEREFIESNAKTTIAHLPVIRLKNLNLAIPDVEEQKRIVGVLREKMTAVEKARKAARAQLTVALELPAAFVRETLRDGKTRSHFLGDCLAEVRNGIGPNWSQYVVLGATREGLAPAKEGVGKAPERYKLVNPVTVFYNPMRILLGSIAMVDDGDATGITSPDYVVLKGRRGILDTRWFYYMTFGFSIICCD